MISPLLIVLDVLAGLVAFFLSREFIVRLNRKGAKEESVDLLSEDSPDNDSVVLDAIENGAKTLNEIMNYTGLPKSTAYKSLKRLLKSGKVERVSNGNGKFRYVVKKGGEGTEGGVGKGNKQ